MEIIKLKAQDCQKFKELRLEALQNDSLAFGSSAEEFSKKPLEEIRERLAGENSLILLAEENGKPIGMIGANFEEGEKLSHIAYIWGVYVNQNYRGQGIGKKLFVAILEEIQKKGKIKKINLNVNTKQIPAIKLYESFGFNIVGTLHKELKIGEEYFDEHAMEKLF